MKYFLLSVTILIAVVSLIAVSLLLQCLLPSSQGTLQSTPNTTLQETPQNIAQSTPSVPCQTTQNTPKPTQQQTNPQTTQTTPARHSNRTLDEAIGNATSYMKNTSEPYAFLWLDVAYRRFNLTAFTDSLQRYDQALAQNSQENHTLLRVFRRIADYNNPMQNGALQAAMSETDKLTVPALYCNRFGLPPNYVSSLTQAVSSQGYMATHALLATIWIQENGYSLSVPASFYSSLIETNAALINDNGVVTDLEIEAATFLTMSGQNAMVNPKFIENVIEAQNRDGGWQTINTGSEGSNWHTSVLALLLLLHQKYSSYSYSPMLATI
jgi:hypothetical protein